MTMPYSRVSALAKYFAIGFGVAALLGATRLIFLCAPVSTDPDEGWNAVHAVLALKGGALYPHGAGLIYTNYPPLSFLLVGLLGKLTGDMIIAGRLWALFGVSCTAFWVWWIGWRLTCNRLAASGALLLFALYNVTICRSYFVMDDPQWLGQSVALVGLALLMPSARPFPADWRLGVAACLFVVAGFFKQNLVGIPLAITIWLALENRHGLMIWLLGACVSLAMAFAICGAIWGVPFFQDIFLTPRLYMVSRAGARSWHFLLDISPMLLGACYLLRFRHEDFRLRLLLLCALTTLITGIIERGGIGVSINAYFETLTVFCVLAGVVLAREISTWKWLALPFILLVPSASWQAWQDITRYPGHLAAFKAMEAQIQAQPGPVVCDDLAYCYWAGQGYRLDFFLYGQQVLTTKTDKTLRDAVANGRISAAQLTLYPSVHLDDPLSALLMQWHAKIIYRQGDQVLVGFPPRS